MVASAGLRWLRGNLRLLDTIEQVNELAGHVFRASFLGCLCPLLARRCSRHDGWIESDTTKHHLARSNVESMSFQPRAILDRMKVDTDLPRKILKSDGDMSYADVAIKTRAGGYYWYCMFITLQCVSQRHVWLP